MWIIWYSGDLEFYTVSIFVKKTSWQYRAGKEMATLFSECIGVLIASKPHNRYREISWVLVFEHFIIESKPSLCRSSSQNWGEYNKCQITTKVFLFYRVSINDYFFPRFSTLLLSLKVVKQGYIQFSKQRNVQVHLTKGKPAAYSLTLVNGDTLKGMRAPE